MTAYLGAETQSSYRLTALPPLVQRLTLLRIGFTDFTLSGREPFVEVVQEIYDGINAEYGTDYEVPGGE